MSSNENKLQLRVKTKNGQFLIDSLKLTDTIGELKSIIWTTTEIHPDECTLKIGYPPQEIFLVAEEQQIQEVIKNKREILTIEERSDGDRIPYQNHAPGSFETIDRPKIRRMERIEVPANNSCLFVSVYFCLTGHMQEKCPELRKLISETVKNDPITYNEGFLGKPNEEYCKWIENEDHWGGGIELSILSKHFETEIVAVDTQNTRLNRFGEDKSYARRIFLIFDGIHYDPLVIHSSDPDHPIQGEFPSTDLSVIEMALEVARKAKANRQYTDLKQMCLICNQCKEVFDQAKARAHASATGHTDFNELREN